MNAYRMTLLCLSVSLTAAAQIQPQASPKFSLEIAGVNCGFLTSIVPPPAGPIAATTEIKVVGSPTCPAFYNWFSAFAASGAPLAKQNGTLIFADADYTEQERIEFSGGYLSALQFPALDRSLTGTRAVLEFTLKADFFRRRLAAGGKLMVDKTQKPVNLDAGNFQFQLDGITGTVSKVEAMRFALPNNTAAALPNVVLVVPEAEAKGFFAWYEDFVIKGNSTDDRKKGLQITYVAVSTGAPLFRFSGTTGIFKLAPEKTATATTVRRVQAELYVEFNRNPMVTVLPR